MPESVTTNEEPMTREEAAEIQKSNDLLLEKNKACEELVMFYIKHTEFFDGWLSPECQAKISFQGKFGYREIDALIKKLEIDRETFQNIEWSQPEEKENVKR